MSYILYHIHRFLKIFYLMVMVYNLLAFYTKVGRKIGANEPIESAIYLFVLFQLSVFALLVGIVWFVLGFQIPKWAFLVLVGCLYLANELFFNKDRKARIESMAEDEVDAIDVFLGLFLWFAATMGMLVVLIPILKLLT